MVAMIEIVSPGNKSGKVIQLLDKRIHLLIIDVFPPGKALADMPLFLEPDGCVEVPLETTYLKAFAAVPKRWRGMLTPATM